MGGATSLLCSDAVSSFYGSFDAVTGTKIHFVVFGCMIQSGSPVDRYKTLQKDLLPLSTGRILTRQSRHWTIITGTLVLGRSVSIATCYELDGPGLQSRLRRDFPHPSRLVLRPTQLPVQWSTCLSQGQSGRSLALTTTPPNPAPNLTLR